MVLALAASAETRRVAVTVDDLPFASGRAKALSEADAKMAVRVNKSLLRGFARQGAPAIGFVNEQRAERLGGRVSREILRRWTRPGFDLGNHLYSHPDVNGLTVAEVEQEMIRGEATFAPLLAGVGRKPEFLRFPFNHTGETREKHDAIAERMAARGYRLAPCTIDGSDYEFNRAYVAALERRDRRTAARVRSEYVAFTGRAIDWYAALNRKVLGYEPPEILLLHASRLNADTIGEILALFRRRGYEFVTLAEAMRDPAYAIPETQVTKFGPMWGYRWARERKVKVNGREEPEVPAWVGEYGR